MGITHIVNAAAGRFHIDTGAKFYKDLPVDYYGVEADDDPKFDLSIYFHPAAKYIRAALNSPRGKYNRQSNLCNLWGPGSLTAFKAQVRSEWLKDWPRSRKK